MANHNLKTEFRLLMVIVQSREILKIFRFVLKQLIYIDIFMRQMYDPSDWIRLFPAMSIHLTAYRNLETYGPDTGAGMLLIHLQPPFNVSHEAEGEGRAKMTH